MTQDYWRWTEKTWCDDTLNWRDAELVTAGVDVGSVSSKAVVLLDGKVFAFSVLRTRSSSSDSAVQALEAALQGTELSLEKIDFIVGTGYGRVNVPFAERTVSEISCHARGAHYIFGSKVRTVLDIGGQDIKVILCDKDGRVVNFLMNDKCAAGTGRGVEVFADLLGVPIEELGQFSVDVEEEPAPVSATCVLFARSEALMLLRCGWSRRSVAAAFCSAMARRIFELLTKLKIERELAITGGIAKNIGIVRHLEKMLGFKPLVTPEVGRFDPQIVGALGAALFAQTFATEKM